MNNQEFTITDFAYIGNEVNFPFNVPICQSKSPSKLKIKNNFTSEEDRILSQLVNHFGPQNWKIISEQIGTRNPRQCRERWNNYVNPEIRKDPFTSEEDEIIQLKVAEFGLKWHKIAKFLHKRSENSIRNRWMVISRMKSKHSSFSYPPIQKQFVSQKILFPEVNINVQEEKLFFDKNALAEFNENFLSISQQNWDEFDCFNF
jgi:hypothetical protein